MYQGTYEIAGFPIKICSLYPDIHTYCASYRAECVPELTVTITRSDLDFERRRNQSEAIREGITGAEWPDRSLETLAVYRKISDFALTRNTLLFHGSVIACGNRACLFTASSGTGKSTHTRLWREVYGSRVYMVNDDKPLLKVTDSGILACGTPWNGKHHLGTNCMVPLQAIVILRRGTENEIREISPGEALPMLMQQSYRSADRTLLARTLSILDTISQQVKFYELHCNMEPEAARISFEGIFGREQP